MAGYLGTKAVLLSTTAADVVGNAEIGGDLTVGGAFTSQGIDDNASATAMTLDASGNVGIGQTSTGLYSFGVTSVGNGYTAQFTSPTSTNTLGFANSSDSAGEIQYQSGNFIFRPAGSEAMRIDSSGNLLVGKTSTSGSVTGLGLYSSGLLEAVADSDIAATLKRLNSDGDILRFRKDGSTVGVIESRSGAGIAIGSSTNGGAGLLFYSSDANIYPVRRSSGSFVNADNQVDLGASSIRFDDIYATNGTIQTSDRNEKQNIEALSDAEQRVAVACKGLLRKFRWKDKVAEKGDDARIHFGIIAQDLQDAFAAEGLDAGRYAMFISTTWWETQTDVPAVEAVDAVDAVYEDVVIPAVEEVLDEEGNVVTEAQPERIEQRLVTEAVEAVEAKDAYTRTDTYETLEEAPEGATERTRLGVRYPELLAFIIGAM